MVDPILILSRADLTQLMTPADYFAAVEAGFRASASGDAHSPPPLHIKAARGGFHAKGALMGGQRSYAALKFNGNFPNNPHAGLPTIQGVIVLADAETGTPLAILDSIEITLRRTAAASAVAAKHLARPGSARIAICGCGAQALPHLEALSDVLPLTYGAVWDIDAAKTESFAAQARSTTGIDLRAAPSLSAATRDADVIVTCTTAQTPFLGREHVPAGAFIAAVGADAPHKSEIKPDLMRAASVFVDSIAQCAVMGDLHHALEAGAVTMETVRAELAQLIVGEAPGRSSAEEVTLFDSTGTALSDVASAALAFERAAEARVGRFVSL